MKCPVCEDQTLESLVSPMGALERCPSCSGLFIHQDLIIAASQDRAKCQDALEETKSLLLPTERWCPKCLQKLFEGRVRSRGVIFSLCPNCESFWTTLSTLRQFEEPIEKTLSVQIEIASSTGHSETQISGGRSTPEANLYEDSGLGSFFRAFARLFDRWADRVSREPTPESEKKPKPVKVKPPKAEKKPLILDVEPTLPAEKSSAAKVKEKPETKSPAPQETAPKIEIPEFIFPEEPVKAPEPEEVVSPKPEIKPSPIETPRVPEPEPEPEPEREPEPVKVVAPSVPESKPEPVPEPKPTPEPAKVVLPEFQPAKRVVAKAVDLPQPKPSGGIGRKLASLFNPKPRPKATPKPVPQPKPKPAPIPKAVPTPKPIAVPKPKGDGVFKKMFGALKPPPRKIIPKPAPLPKPEETVKPEEPPKISPAPVVEKKPVQQVEPVKAVPAPVPKKTSAPIKLKKVKAPRDPMDHVAVWPPWALALLAVVLSAFRDFGFEAAPAALWGLAGWAIGLMVRLSRLYPFKPFADSTLQSLSQLPEASSRRAIPVILKGQIVPAREENPKGEVVFKEEDKIVILNRLSRWDILPRLFGLSNPRQLLKGDVTVKGWYRGGITSSLEVHEVRAEKTFRKSMVRSLRWASAVMILLIALVVYFSLE